MSRTRTPWAAHCARCGTWHSTLDVHIEDGRSELRLDEAQRSEALRELRELNFQTVLDAIAEQMDGTGGRLLDVGSAHGWFVNAASSRGLLAQGLEPDSVMVETSRLSGATVRHGLFPDALEPAELFDVISINDVLEHIPDVDAAIEACSEHLAPRGLLSINIPNAKGIIYRAAALLARIGVRTPFDRLWQKGLPSPHLWYFTPEGLTRLVERHGFTLVHDGRLDSITRSGLWQRLHFDRRPGIVSAIAFVGMWLAAPVLNTRGTSDIMFLLFRKTTPA